MKSAEIGSFGTLTEQVWSRFESAIALYTLQGSGSVFFRKNSSHAKNANILPLQKIVFFMISESMIQQLIMQKQKATPPIWLACSLHFILCDFEYCFFFWCQNRSAEKRTGQDEILKIKRHNIYRICIQVFNRNIVKVARTI